MKALNRQATSYFRKLIALRAEGSRYFDIRNGGLMRFVVEPLYTIRRNGLPEATLWSISFCTSLNGDTMRDPEVCFAVTEHGVYPYMLQNDYTGLFIQFDYEHFYSDTKAQADINRFANAWMAELKAYEMHKGIVTQYA